MAVAPLPDGAQVRMRRDAPVRQSMPTTTVPSAGCGEITERIAQKELRVVVAIHSAP